MRKLSGLLLSIIYCFIATKIAIQFYTYELLPTNYKLLLIGIYAIALLLILTFLLRIVFKKLSKESKKQKKLRRRQLRKKTFADVILLLFCVILFFINSFYASTNQFINSITNNFVEPSEINCYVYVSSDSQIKTINDLDILNIGFSEEDKPTIYTLVNNKLEHTYNRIQYVDYQTDIYTSENTLYNSLQDNDIQAMIITKTTKDTLNSTYSTFNQDVRLIETITIKTNVDSIAVDVANEPFNVLIMGVDIRSYEGDIYSKTRIDTLMLITFNPKTMEMQMTSIPRDSYVPVTCDNDTYDKITHTGNYSIGCTIDTVEELLDLDINYYAKFNFDALVNIVDSLGGVTVDVQYSFTEQDSEDNPESISLEKGIQVLKGEEALAYARHRLSVDDHQRNYAQQQVLTAIISKLSSFSVITKFDNLLKVMQNNMITNMTRNEIYSLATLLPNMKQLQSTSFVIGGEDELYYVPKYNQYLYVTHLDETSIYDIRESIKRIMGVDNLTRTEDNH